MEIPRESHTEWPGSSNLGGRCLLNRRGLLREASVKQMGTSFPGSLLAFVSIGVRSEEDTASQMGCELVIRKLLWTFGCLWHKRKMMRIETYTHKKILTILESQPKQILHGAWLHFLNHLWSFFLLLSITFSFNGLMVTLAFPFFMLYWVLLY